MNKTKSDFHGGNYKQYCSLKGIDWFNVTDYSTSINWNAKNFYPENLLYLHYENIEYPDPNYNELTEIISSTYNINKQTFLLTNGANEAISIIFQFLMFTKTFESKSILFVGPVYSEYTKYTDILNLDYSYTSISSLKKDFNSIKHKVVVIVNPNTPTGQYYDIEESILNLCKNGNMVILDESFIDFMDIQAFLEKIENFNNLFIIKSFTKFYGSAGARLGLIASSNKKDISSFRRIAPCWNISAYDNWFYKNMIRKYKDIKSSTILWIKELHNQLSQFITDADTFKLIECLNLHYCSFEINPDKLNLSGKDLKNFFLENYMIFVRPIGDFYGFNENCFRIGLRLPHENIKLINALKDLK